MILSHTIYTKNFANNLFFDFHNVHNRVNEGPEMSMLLVPCQNNTTNYNLPCKYAVFTLSIIICLPLQQQFGLELSLCQLRNEDMSSNDNPMSLFSS